MSYFTQIDSCQTYNGQKYDFHYDYNGNSGGGQPFLGGQFALNNSGDPGKPLYLNGKIATFVVRFVDSDGSVHDVNLDTKDEYHLPVTPRSTGSKQMKLKTKGKLVRPSLLLPAVLMLPETTTVDMATSLETSPLTTGNYWLQSMWLDCELADDIVHFIPKDYVFSGGTSKRGEYATQDGKPTGNVMFFELDYGRRINDILYAADNCEALSHPAAAILQYFRDVLLGSIPFDHKDCYTKTAELMSLMALAHPTTYAGIDDPLPTIMEAVGKPNYACEPIKAALSEVPEPRNLIFFGAPGTGKSYQLNKLGVRTKVNPGGIFSKDHVRRVTFYPDYTYSQFVGSYRPFTKGEKIGYHYIAGPFLKTYIEASTHPFDNYLLIIEELNRANPAAVFGDIFQLLDRDAFGTSEYYVSVPMEMAACIKESLDKLYDVEKNDIESYFDPDMDFDDFCESMLRDLSLPSNMYIWATMNSADQGVFPMDTAFKRRWDFRYMGIDEGEDATPPALKGERLDKYAVNLNGMRIVWNELRKAINTLLLDYGVNEDKLLGPFFLSPEALSDETYGDEGKSRFVAAFEDKVLLYLYEDAGKMRRKDIFRDGNATFADICIAFERDGIEVFTQRTDKHGDIFTDVVAPTVDPNVAGQDNED